MKTTLTFSMQVHGTIQFIYRSCNNNNVIFFFYFRQTSIYNIQMFKIHIMKTMLKKKNMLK